MSKPILALSLAAALSLGACSATSPAVTPTTINAAVQQAAVDINLVAGGLAAITPTLAGLGLPPATVTQIQGYVATLQADAKSISAAVAASTTPSTTTVQEIATVTGQIATAVLTALPGGGAAVVAVQAAQALVPVILAAFHVTGAAPVATMTPDEARLILSKPVLAH